MLSPSDTIFIFVVALLLFGPEQLPKIARQLGNAMRHVQSTTSAFMAEMDRAAAAHDRPPAPKWNPPSTDLADPTAAQGEGSAAKDDQAKEPPAPGATNPTP